MFTKPKNIVSEKEHGFTLIELIVVIIIVGILAAVGLTQYSTIVEKSRLAEAKTNIGVMRQLTHEYYLNNGTTTCITNSDVGVDYTCYPTNFYRYMVGDITPTRVTLQAIRCTGGGKTPNISRQYIYYFEYYPGTGQGTAHCYYFDDHSSCFGYPP